MPSRFLTLWSMLSKPASQQQSPPKKKNKKDTQTPQVHYRTGYVAPLIPVYGELDVDADDVVVPVLENKTEPTPPTPPKTTHALPPSSSEGAVKLRLSSRRSKSKADIDVDRRASQSTLTRSTSVFRRSFFRSKSVAPPPQSALPTVTKSHQSVESLALKNRREDPLYQSRVTKSISVGGLSQRSLRVCQAKRVAPPIVPNSESASLSSSQQLHRHSGSSFDSGGSAESSSGGYCSATGSLSSCNVASSSSAWSSSGVGGSAADQRSSIGLDDTFLPPPPPASPPATVLHHKHHMYSRGESESVYSGRNLGSPGFGGPGGIFTYPANGIYGQIGQHQRNRSGSSGSSQLNSPHVHGSTTIMMERDSSALGNTTAASTTVLLPHPNYNHQMSLEDQGIDLTQSPGRESPSSSSSTASVGLKSNNSSSGASSAILAGSGSSCRHSTTSTTSLDSGRASGSFSHHHGQPALLSQQQHQQTQHNHLQQPQNHGQQQHQRFSGQSYETGCLRNSYHSSSSSLGSSNGSKIDDIHRLNICEMLSQGVPEHEILNAWLTDLGFEEYYDVFVQSGYDMHTITRMTPEDLTAIGIQKPNHRKKLKSEIALLQIPDGLPDFIPDTLEEWLALLGLAEYSPSLRRQGYRTVEDVTQLTWEDLEDFGILRLGHQKKITLAIKRVKDILAGKYVPLMHMETSFSNSAGSPDQPHQHHHLEPLSSFQQQQQQQQQQPYRPPSSASSHYAIPPSVMRPVYQQQQQQQQQQIYHHHYSQQQQQPIYQQHYQISTNQQYQQPTYQPDVVAIQVHRNRSSEDLRICPPPAPAVEPIQQTFYKPGWRQRSYEDGDVTPVSENGHHTQQSHVPGGGTLPRPRGTVKPRPVAKISAKTRSDCCPLDSSGELKGLTNQQPQYGTLSKRNPPPAPPKRNSSSSISSAEVVGLTVESDPIYGRSAKSSPLPLPPPPPPVHNDSINLLSYSDDSEDFPPPPAPITASDSYLQHGQHSSAAASVRERLDNILQRSGAGHWPARPHSQQSGNYGVPTTSRSSVNSMSGLKMVGRECSPSESIETSDTEPGSPAMEFRQRRNGSDASFKSTSSTESDSMPFANDNAGTIKQRSARTHPALAALNYSSLPAASVLSPSLARRAATNSSNKSNLGASDVLNDIGNMLADLTDELDSMLEEESSNQPLMRQKS